MSHDENEQQHIKQTRQSIHLQSQPHKKGSPLGGGDNRGNTRIGVVGDTKMGEKGVRIR